MTEIFKTVRDSFSAELKKEGDTWRILRKGTLVDLIKLSFYHFQRDKDKKHLVDVLNNCMKIKLLSRIKAIEVKETLEEMSKQFSKEDDFILNQYDTIYNEIEPSFKNYSASNLYDLNGKIQYIKVVNELEIDSYTDDVFEEIIGITYNILKSE